MNAPPHMAESVEWYPPSWFVDWERGSIIHTQEGWSALCMPCAEYVIHTRPGGGWVERGPGEADHDCARCGAVLTR